MDHTLALLRVLWQQFQMYGFFFYYYCLTLKSKLAFSRDTQVFFFSRVREVGLNGVLLNIRHKSQVFGFCLF